MGDLLGRFDAGQLVGRISEILRDPTSNLVASLLILAAFAIVLLFVVLLAAMFVLNASDEDEQPDADEFEGEAGVPGSALDAASSAVSGTVVDDDAPELLIEPEPAKPWPIRAGVFFLWTTLVLMLTWIAVGAATAQTSACVSCHTDNPHKRISNVDPHEGTACFRCHESGGIVGALTYMVPSRAAHYAAGILQRDPLGTYGKAAPSSGCTQCHAATLKSTVSVEPQGIRVSHKEPLAAGAECVDCHAMNSGVVSNHTVGMAPCLRCHDGEKVKSDCGVCHTRDPGVAIRPAQVAADRSRDRIGQPNCGSCHNQKKCDACHGVRLPHSREFMVWQHARAGVEDIWNNGGRTCGKCHNATRRPCTKCHVGFPNHPISVFKATHGAGGPNNNACICHEARRYVAGRNMCGLCHPEYVNSVRK